MDNFNAKYSPDNVPAFEAATKIKQEKKLKKPMRKTVSVFKFVFCFIL